MLKLAVVAILLATFASPALVNRRVVRKINLSKHLTTIETSVTVVNDGTKAVSRLQLLPDPNLEKHLSSFLVYVNGESVWLNPETWQAQLANTIDPDASIDLTLEEIYTHATKPLPLEIKQNQDQYMTYSGNLHYFSPYMTRREKVSVRLPSTKVVTFTPDNAKVTGKTLEYPEFKDVVAQSNDLVYLHYEANIPYVTTHYLLREIEVSHWGNVAVRDFAEVRHVGAKLSGSFSRVTYSHDGGDDASDMPWVPKLVARLPAKAQSVFYRDAIGNISTSRLRQDIDRVTVELRPRTPLFGGWKSDYILGFNLPSEQALFYKKSDPSRYVLSLKAIDELYPDQVVDQVEIQVILPEPAENIEVKIPAGFERGHDRIKFTYLDITGRPVVILRAENLAGTTLDQMLQVEYTYAGNAILREPGMVIVFIFTIFLVVILIMRLDFTISDDGASDLKARINAAFMKAQEANYARSQAHNQYIQAINRYRETKDLSLLTEKQKLYRTQIQSFLTTVKDIIEEHKKVVGDKLSQVQEYANQVQTHISKGEPSYQKIKDLDQKINQALDN